MLAHHVTSRRIDSGNITPTVAEARVVSDVLLRLDDRYGLVLFSCPGDHIHASFLCDRETAGQAARAYEAAITLILGGPGFRRCRVRPILSLDHFTETVGYTFGQNARHDVHGDALLEGSNLLDVLSARLVNTRSARLLKQLVPELDRARLASHLGGYPAPGSDLTRLVESVRVVTAGKDTTRRDQRTTRALGAAARLALGIGVTSSTAAELLGCSRRFVNLANRREDIEADHAISVALGLLQRHPHHTGSSPITLPSVVTWERNRLPGAEGRAWRQWA